MAAAHGGGRRPHQAKRGSANGAGVNWNDMMTARETTCCEADSLETAEDAVRSCPYAV